MDKRSFVKQMSLAGLGIPFSLAHIEKLVSSVESFPIRQVAENEEFWAAIRAGYRLKPDYINLESGYYCMLPQETLENYINHIREVNYNASWYMRTVQWENKERNANKLARLAGCAPEELIITRNATESLDMVIGGQGWNEGDEAVMAQQDYGAMLNHFKLMEQRFGVVNKLVSLPNHPKNDQEIVDLYANAITPKTKLLMVCHMVNITGQILPVRSICDMAHAKGVDVMVDGAHAFGHINFSLDDLDCDYYGTSLHKWLSVPLGAGFLYVNKEKINGVWPLLAEDELEPDDISRLNHTGTHPVHTDLAINNAIDYHNKIGADRKEARLRYLQHYWTGKVRDLPNIIVNTPADQRRHCAIGNVGIKGMDPKEMAKLLLEKHQIWTVAINRPGVQGVRVTPNVFTTTKELDIFVEALKDLSK